MFLAIFQVILQIEQGRKLRIPRNQRVCKICDSGEAEDDEHFCSNALHMPVSGLTLAPCLTDVQKCSTYTAGIARGLLDVSMRAIS